MATESQQPCDGIVDSHQHFLDVNRFKYYWVRPDKPILQRSYLPNDLEPLLRANGVRQTIVVQAHPSVEEAEWLLALADAHPFIAGIVPWVDLTASNIKTLLDRYVKIPKVRSVRYTLVEDMPADTLLRKDVLNGLESVARSGLPYDLLLRWHHLPSVPVALRRVPGLKTVVEHIAKPDIATRRMQPWADGIAAVAEFPDVYCKLSGLVTEADHARWTADDLRPYVQHVVKCFGFERIMWGSDWPVCLLAASYDRVLSSTLEAIGTMTVEQRTRFLRSNASRFYGLDKVV
jgi:L-fuconolactonase